MNLYNFLIVSLLLLLTMQTPTELQSLHFICSDCFHSHTKEEMNSLPATSDCFNDSMDSLNCLEMNMSSAVDFNKFLKYFSLNCSLFKTIHTSKNSV